MDNTEQYCRRCKRWLSLADGDVFLADNENDYDRCSYCQHETSSERTKLDSGADSMVTL